MAKKKLGELLLEAGILNDNQLEYALKVQEEKGGKLGQVLIELGLVSEKLITDLVSQQRNFVRIHLDVNELDPNIVSLVPKDICQKYRLIPYKIENNMLVVAMDDPMNYFAIEMAEFASSYRIEPAIVEPSKIDEALLHISDAQEILPTQVEDKYEKVVGKAAERGAPPKEAKGSIIKFVNMLLVKGIEFDASDLHIEADAQYSHIRYRINGVLHEKFRVPNNYHENVISRLKVMAKLDISQHDVPQTGGFRLEHKGEKYTMRIETIPTVRGENAAIRYSGKGINIASLDKLGLSRSELGIIAENIFKPGGLIIVCGPTGSGKTTTLYAILRRINTPEKKIITLEDPVEEFLPLINQIQIDENKGLTFSSALRAVLRMDPDVIFIGEIRDQETAQIALRAAYTGHLVLTTLHTRNTFESITRLIDLGIEPFMLSNTINLIISQRLVRTLCAHCKTQTEVEGVLLYHPRGCEKCKGTGYIGRTGVFELLPGSFITRDVLLPTPSLDKMLERARAARIETLWKKAMKKVLAGETSMHEVVRVIPKMPGDE